MELCEKKTKSGGARQAKWSLDSAVSSLLALISTCIYECLQDFIHPASYSTLRVLETLHIIGVCALFGGFWASLWVSSEAELKYTCTPSAHTQTAKLYSGYTSHCIARLHIPTINHLFVSPLGSVIGKHIPNNYVNCFAPHWAGLQSVARPNS